MGNEPVKKRSATCSDSLFWNLKRHAKHVPDLRFRVELRDGQVVWKTRGIAKPLRKLFSQGLLLAGRLKLKFCHVGCS